MVFDLLGEVMGESKICSEYKQFNLESAKVDVRKQQSHPVSGCSIVSIVIYQLYHYAMQVFNISLTMLFPSI